MVSSVGFTAPAVGAEQSLAERTRLTGDWGGARTALEDKGIEVVLQYIGETLGVSGGTIPGGPHAAFEGRLDMIVNTDLEKLVGWTGGQDPYPRVPDSQRQRQKRRDLHRLDRRSQQHRRLRHHPAVHRLVPAGIRQVCLDPYRPACSRRRIPDQHHRGRSDQRHLRLGRHHGGQSAERRPGLSVGDARRSAADQPDRKPVAARRGVRRRSRRQELHHRRFQRSSATARHHLQHWTAARSGSAKRSTTPTRARTPRASRHPIRSAAGITPAISSTSNLASIPGPALVIPLGGRKHYRSNQTARQSGRLRRRRSDVLARRRQQRQHLRPRRRG